MTSPKKRICMVGSGNFASAIVRNVAANASANPSDFDFTVRMWVFEEEVDDGGQRRNLSQVINDKHENVKYLPGVALPHNVVAVPDLAEAADGADVVIFCLPHQFIEKVMAKIHSHSQLM